MALGKHLAAAACLVLYAAAASASSVHLLPAAAKPGEKASAVVWGSIDGALPENAITGAAIVFEFDTAAAALPAATDIIPGPGWARNDVNLAYGPGQIAITLTNTSDTGQAASGPIATIRITKVGTAAGTMRLDQASSFMNAFFDVVPFSTQPVSLTAETDAPTRISVLGARARPGEAAPVTIWAAVNDVSARANIPQHASIVLDFDTAAAAAGTSAQDYAAGPGWTVTGYNPAAGPGKVSLTLDCDRGQYASGPIAIVSLRKVGGLAGTVRLDPSSSFSSLDATTMPFSLDPADIINDNTGPFPGANSFITILPATAPAGQQGPVTVWAQIDEPSVAENIVHTASIVISYSQAAVAASVSLDDVKPGPGWKITEYNPFAGDGLVSVKLTNDSTVPGLAGAHGQSVSGPIATVGMWKVGPAPGTVSLSSASVFGSAASMPVAYSTNPVSFRAVEAPPAPAPIRVLPAGARPGQKAAVTVWADVVAGSDLRKAVQSAVVVLRFDPAAVDVTSATFEAGPGWELLDSNPAYGPGQAAATLVNNTDPGGQTDPGPIVTVRVTKLGPGVGSAFLDPASSFGSGTFDGLPFDMTPAIITSGPVRSLGAEISGSPSVGFDTVALVAGGNLRLLNASDLTDRALQQIPGAITGRPAFGAYQGQPVVGIGTTMGYVLLYNVNTGAPVAPLWRVGDGASSPAITGDGHVFATAHWDGPMFVNVETGAFVPLLGSKAIGDPAIFSDMAIQATDYGVTVIRASNMAPQIFLPDSAMVSSPVLAPHGTGVIASRNSIYSINAVTGAIGGTGSASLTSPVTSEGWYAPEDGAFYFGAANGLLARWWQGKVSMVPSHLNGTIVTQPLVINNSTYTVDAEGNYRGGSTVDPINLGHTPLKAMAATGRGPQDSIIAVTADGTVMELPL